MTPISDHAVYSELKARAGYQITLRGHFDGQVAIRRIDKPLLPGFNDVAGSGTNGTYGQVSHDPITLHNSPEGIQGYLASDAIFTGIIEIDYDQNPIEEFWNLALFHGSIDPPVHTLVPMSLTTFQVPSETGPANYADLRDNPEPGDSGWERKLYWTSPVVTLPATVRIGDDPTSEPEVKNFAYGMVSIGDFLALPLSPGLETRPQPYESLFTETDLPGIDDLIPTRLTLDQYMLDGVDGGDFHYHVLVSNANLADFNNITMIMFEAGSKDAAIAVSQLIAQKVQSFAGLENLIYLQ
jgi:hypothetical protein